MKVHQLVDRLSQCNPNAEVVILDADTEWDLEIETVSETPQGVIEIAGNYGNVRGRP